MDQHHPANKRVSICILRQKKFREQNKKPFIMVSKSENDLPKSENDLPTMMAQLANERKQNGMDIQFPVKNILQKHIQKHTTPVIISMETSLPFPLIFPFLPMDSGSFSGPGGGTQARNWPMLSSKRFIERRIALSML